MIMPIGDENLPGARTPVVNWVLIALNVAGFLLQLSQGERFTYRYSTTPKEITTGTDIDQPVTITLRGLQGRAEQVQIEHGPGPRPIYLTLLTSMFMHGGWMHLLGNMLFLWVFGDNVEHAIGHVRYLLFYLLCGLAASAAHIVSDPNSVLPSLGASGAISGVLGAYIVLFPRNRIRVLMGHFVTTMPALVVLGLWILLQFVSGLGGVFDTEQTGGGVAYWAHIGGFVAGVAGIFLFRLGTGEPEPVSYRLRRRPRFGVLSVRPDDRRY
jgi:membrane associated rhomboid family serine protease